MLFWGNLRFSRTKCYYYSKWKTYQQICLVVIIIVIASVAQVKSVDYRTFDLVNDGRGKFLMRRSDNYAQTGFSARSGSLGTRGRYPGSSRRDPEYTDEPDDYDTSAPSYYTVNENGEELDQDECDRRPCIAIDRADDKEHSFTINVPKLNGRHQIFKKFVVQPVIQYVVKYDKSPSNEGDRQASASTQYDTYEGPQGQYRMQRKHERSIDRFFNDIDARFEGYWGNDDNTRGGGGNGGNGGYDGRGGGNGYYDGSNTGDYQDGGSYYSGSPSEGGSGVDFNFGFGNGGSGSEGQGYGSGGMTNANQQENIDGFVSSGVYGSPGMSSGAPGNSIASSGGSGSMMMGGDGATSINGMGGTVGFSSSNGMRMPMPKMPGQSAISMGGNALHGQFSMGTNGQSGGASRGMMEMGKMSMPQMAPHNSNGMTMGSAIPSRGAIMSPLNSVPSATPNALYGVPGMTPRQPLGPMSSSFQPSNGMLIGNGGNAMTMGSRPMMPMQTSGQVSGSPMSSGGAMSVNGGGTGGFSQMMNGGGGNGFMTNSHAQTSTNFPQGSTVGNQMMGDSSGTNSPVHSVSFHGNGMISGQQFRVMNPTSDGATKGDSINSQASTEQKGGRGTSSQSPSYGPPTSSSNNPSKGSASLTESNENSDRPLRPPRGKRPSGAGSAEMGGAGDKPKGRGNTRGRGRKSLLSTLSSNLPKIPTNIGGHLSFMFSTGFGKNRKGRGGNGGGGSKPGEDGKSKPIDKEQVSDHILNILGLTVHHPPVHSINSSQSTSYNPIVLWELQGNGNSSSLTQLASSLPEDTLGDLAAIIPITEDVNAKLFSITKDESEKTEDDDKSTATPTTVPFSTTPSLPEYNMTDIYSTISQMTTTKSSFSNLTLNQAQAIVTSSNDSSPYLPMHTSSTTPSVPSPSPVSTTSPRPSQLPHSLTSNQLSFREPKTLTLSPQTQFFPIPIPVYLTPPSILAPKPSGIISSPASFPQTNHPSQDYIEYKLNRNNYRNNVLTIEDEDIVESMTISPPTLIPSVPSPTSPSHSFPSSPTTLATTPHTERPQIEAYYAEADYPMNPIRLTEFDPMIYDALQAAFQPFQEAEASYYSALPGLKRKRMST